MNRRPIEPRTPRESKSALLEAAQAAVAAKQVPVDAPREGSPRRTATRIALGLALLVGSGLLLSRPAWLAGPALPQETLAIRAASATLALVDAVSRVSAFQAARGVLPATLQDAGVANPDIDYRRLAGDHFEVRMLAGDSTVVMRSSDSLKPAVVRAILTLQQRP